MNMHDNWYARHCNSSPRQQRSLVAQCLADTRMTWMRLLLLVVVMGPVAEWLVPSVVEWWECWSEVQSLARWTQCDLSWRHSTSCSPTHAHTDGPARHHTDGQTTTYWPSENSEKQTRGQLQQRDHVMRQTDRWTHGQTGRQTSRHTDRQPDRDRQTDRHTDCSTAGNSDKFGTRTTIITLHNAIYAIYTGS